MTNHIHILVVDDNQINRQYFSMALTKHGYHVDVAESGYEAIELSSKKQYQFIIMDMRMPEIDGRDTALKIRALKEYQDTPIVAISAEQEFQTHDNVFNDSLLKPISPNELKLLVEKYCHSRTNSKLPVFDRDKALKYAYNDQQIMLKLIKLFCNDMPKQVEQLTYSISHQNKQESLDLIHKFRGSCLACGAIDLDNKLKKLSTLIKKDNQLQIDENMIAVKKASLAFKKIGI